MVDSFCSCVQFLFVNGAISRGVAIQANEFISQNLENQRDYGPLFAILDDYTDSRQWEFESREVSLLLEFGFANNLHFLENRDSDGNIKKGCFPEFFVQWAQAVSRGIARKIVELRRLRGESAYFGRLYYSESAFTILCELAYNSTEWEIHRIESIHHETANVPYAAKRPNGMIEETTRERSAFILNNEIVLRNTKRVQLIERDFLKCENSLVFVTPTGDVVIPCKREMTEVEVTNKATGKRETVKRLQVVEIEPTFSFLRLFLTVVSNSFFVLELGPQNRKVDTFNSENGLVEHRDARRSRKSEIEEEIDVVLGSENFSEQEKNVARALVETIGKQFDNGVLSIASFRQAGRGVMFKQFYENFCAFANSQPHKDHFRKMVKNFKRHVRRYFDID